MSTTSAPITPQTFDESLLGKAPARSANNRTTDALCRIVYGGQDAHFQVRGTACRPYLTFYDPNAAGFNGKKGAYVSKPASEIPITIKKVKANIDMRGARKAFHNFPDATDDDRYQLSAVRMIMGVESFVMEIAREDLRRTNHKLPAGRFDVSPFYNSCLVGSPLEGDPFYTNEKGEQKLAPLTLSFSLYLKPRETPGEPAQVDDRNTSIYRITGWQQRLDEATGQVVRGDPILTAGNWFDDFVGGANAYIKFSFGQPNIYLGKINAEPKPDSAFVDPSTRWSAGSHQDPEEAAKTAAIEW